MEIREEGTYFQDDSDKPKDEDSMWWWNGWYQVLVEVYYGFEIVGTGLDGGINGGSAWFPTGASMKAGLWADVMLKDTNELFDWYWNQILFKFAILDVKPIVMTLSAPFNPIRKDAEYCMNVGWDLNLFKFSTRIFENMKICQQSLLKLHDDEEAEPICNYDANNESDIMDGWLNYDIWNSRIDPDGDNTNWYGTHSYYDRLPLCFSINDPIDW
eukprot:NODE_3105_length_816_cov_103.745763_g2583_i0.p1 GENE.NODE_3105_length_816_cov_103.745763_g2583_i0~~NODE_3105_length_816_cov_103.745763_g2583_i0.p1  ORF type:complete len:214 (-),score=31.65 NODE_3105_length_816_cov_103.745763_g2583_i0:27-668(-)